MAKFTKNEIKFISSIAQDQCHAPNLLLRHYQDLELSDRECILLISIMSAIPNGEQEFGAADLQNYWDCSQEDAEAMIAGFVHAGLLTKVSGKGLEPRYSLKGLYEELLEIWVYLQACPPVAQKKNPTPKTASSDKKVSPQTIKELYRLFEGEKGQPLTPTEIEKLNHWIIDDGWPAPMIKEALQRAVLHGTCNFAYLDKIFLRWQKNGIKTMEQLQDDEKKQLVDKPKKNRKPIKKEKLMTNDTDYNEIYNL